MGSGSDGLLYGGVEAGGTKFVCAVGTGPDDIRAEARFPTTTPAETLGQTIDFFRKKQAAHPLAAVGIGAFGPMDPNPASPTYGYITSTPKPGWSQTDFAGTVRRALGIPVGWDTDVNVAALGEFTWGAARGLDTFLYLTIGTGIGGGGLSNGKLQHGLIHPEMGHIRIPHDLQKDPYPGRCPYHGDCFEGLACGPVLQDRWGQRAENLPPEHPAWSLEAHYLALALMNYACTLSPQRIILGGGVMGQARLYPMVRRELQELLNGYIVSQAILKDIDHYVVPPGLGNRSGVLGAIALARQSVISE
ncbi:MAG TPA: ROK family protein [Anaerolineales bacterium]